MFPFFPPVSQRQLEVMNEVKEFEAEMQRHSHRYPHDILTCRLGGVAMGGASFIKSSLCPTLPR